MNPADLGRPVWPGSPITRLHALTAAAALVLGALLGIAYGRAATVQAMRLAVEVSRQRDGGGRA